MNPISTRLQREKKTVDAMILLYCKRQHSNSETPCIECYSLLKYCEQRLIHCPFGDSKPTCANCTIHCYNTFYKNKIKSVMKSAGPHMIYTHPILTLRHYIDQYVKKPISYEKIAQKL